MRTISNNLKLKNKKEFQMLKSYSKHANSLYNCSLYFIKEFYKTTGKYIGYGNLDKEMQKNFHYQSMPSFNAQQIIRLVDKNYRSYFSLLRKKLRGEYPNDISEPKFRKKHDFFILIFDNTRMHFSKRETNKLKIYKNLKVNFSYKIENIKQGIIKWNGKNFQIFITYEQKNKDEKRDNKNYLSIDLGLNNFATCISNVGRSFIINGKPLKSYNQFYNKQIAKIKSELKTKNNKHWSKRLSLISNKKARYVNNYMNQSVAMIVKYCIKNDINSIVLGYNEGWKQKINLGTKTNQNFTNVPFHKFRQKMESKCEKEGINLVLTGESYTSKTSFLDKEEPKKQEEYKGRRIKRGLFKSSSGKLINADCNGAAQILCKKVVLNLEQRNRIGAFITMPKKINLFIA